MSCTFDIETLLIFTGGVDGTLIGWNFETQFARYYMHEWDPTCVSENFIRDSKSVDSIVIMDFKRLLISMSADQILRFWDLTDLQSAKGPVFWMHANHHNP
jgi:WD40 repeat protein